MRLIFSITAVATLALAVLAPAGSPAVQLTKRQYIARGDAICHDAIANLDKLGGQLYPASRAARVGDRWLAIDRFTLRRLRALSPPARDRATVKHMLELADIAVNKGIAGVVKSAKTGSKAAYTAAIKRATRMINAAHAAARRYGFSTCSRW